MRRRLSIQLSTAVSSQQTKRKGKADHGVWRYFSQAEVIEVITDAVRAVEGAYY